MVRKIGLMVGREWSFPPAFIDEVERRSEGLVVDYVKLGTPTPYDPSEYAVIVDRISHEVPFYRSFLRNVARRGVRVINDPDRWVLEDIFTVQNVASRIGVRVPRLAMLPHREYAEGIVHEESLRNLDYPLDWDAVVNHVGLPCLLRAAGGHGDPRHVCHSVEEVLDHYNGSGQRLMVLQEILDWDQYVRCFVVGREVLPLRYDPGERRYHVDHAHLTPELGRQVVDESIALCTALGLVVNTVDFAIRDGTPYAVEFLNPIPEIDIYALTPEYFDWVVGRMADLAIEYAGGARNASAYPTRPEFREPDGAGDLAEQLPGLARDLPKPRL